MGSHPERSWMKRRVHGERDADRRNSGRDAVLSPDRPRTARSGVPGRAADSIVSVKDANVWTARGRARSRRVLERARGARGAPSMGLGDRSKRFSEETAQSAARTRYPEAGFDRLPVMVP